MLVQLLRSNVSFRKVIADAYFHTMESPLAQPFTDNAENSISRTSTFTTRATKARAGSSKQAILLSKSLSTGHKDWKMLRRYTRLRPEHLHIARVKKAIERSVDLPAA